MLVARQLPEDSTIPTDADQFRAVVLGWQRNGTRGHDRRFKLAVPEVSKTEAVPYFMQHYGHLVVDGQRGKVDRVHGDETRAIGKPRCCPSYVLSIEVCSRLVKLDIDGRGSKPEAPQNDGGCNKVFKHRPHATPASQPRGPGG